MKAIENIGWAKFRSRLIHIALCSVLMVSIVSLKTNPEWVEKYYSCGLYNFIRGGILFVFNYIPLSVGDLLYVGLIILMLAGCYRLIRFLAHKRFRHASYYFLGFMLKVEIAVCAFYVLWALHYFRLPAAERLSLQDYDYSQEELISVTAMLIDSANTVRSSLLPADLAVSNADITRPAVEAINDLTSFNPAQYAIRPTVKTSLLSPVLNYLGTAGYYNPFTGEAQFNSMMPLFSRPFVAAHEMAHQMGFGAEDEANFMGFIAGKSSANRLLKYSAYYLASQEFMTQVWRADSIAFKQMKERLSPAVLEDLQTEREYWQHYRGDAARLSSVFYDNYLRANKQPGGLKTYNRMIRLCMAYYHREGLIN
jgi:hypothetical protein